jgi:hypothetical protein
MMAHTQKIRGKERECVSKKTGETEEGQDSIHGPATGVNPSARPIISPGIGYMPNY